jgi:predicted Zn-dependent protease
MTATLRVLASGALLTALAGCASDLFSPDAPLGQIAMATGLAPQMDDAEEKRIGEQAAATLLGAAPLLNNAAIQIYVNRVGTVVARSGKRPELEWAFGVLDDETVNAFAAPGGTVLITKGLLRRLNDESELAGVLAHEVVHVEKKHHLRTVIQSGVAGNAASRGLSYATGGRGAEYTQIATSAFTNLYSRGLGRDDELEADREGVQLARRAGYDAYGLIAVLQSLDAMNPADASLTLLLKTHPRPADRLTQLSEFAAENLPEDPGAPNGRARFRQAIAQLGR